MMLSHGEFNTDAITLSLPTITPLTRTLPTTLRNGSHAPVQANAVATVRYYQPG